MSKLSRGLAIGFILLVNFLLSTANSADLIFTSPPRESPATGEIQYGPVAAYLTKLLKTKVTYKHPGNWLNYQREMRDNKYDIVFDGPHFASWRMAHIGHDMIAKLPGSLVFYLVRKKDDSSINSLRDLIGKRICGISMPNLSTLSILSGYPNPARQPVIVGVKGGMKGVAKALGKNRCNAYVFRDKFFNKAFKPEVRDTLQIIYTSKPMPNQAISAGQRVTPAQKKAMTHSLTIGNGVDSTQSIRKRFAGKARSMVKATNEEYQNYNMLLEGVIFGW